MKIIIPCIFTLLKIRFFILLRRQNNINFYYKVNYGELKNVENKTL
jgi:hypothetical protein